MLLEMHEMAAVIPRRGLVFGVGALLVYSLAAVYLQRIQAYDQQSPLKVGFAVVGAVIAQALLLTLQRWTSAGKWADAVWNALWFWLVFSLCVTADAFLWHPGLSKDIPGTASEVLLYSIRLFCVLGIPMTLVNLALLLAFKRTLEAS